jgi:tRNA modification GTPase
MLSARAEAAIDYVGDEDETGIDLEALSAEARNLAREWDKWLAQPPAELLAHGLQVVLAGPPNSGKSSLFNALVGSEKAIVTSIPGTTRDVLEAPIDLAGLPLLLLDTAGLRDSDDEVERIGVTRAERAQSEADLLLWLGDPMHAPIHPNPILVHSRADEREAAPEGSIPTSVLSPDGWAELRDAIIGHASALLPPVDQAALNRRQRASLAEATSALRSVPGYDLLLLAEGLRLALVALDHLSGRQGTEDVLDALFSSFCLGK